MADRLREVLDTVAEVDTPELARFRHRVAGPASRGLAYGIDLLVRAVALTIFAVVASLAGLLSNGDAEHATRGVLLLVGFLMEWAYFVFFEMTWNGASPGKRALGLRVVTSTGRPLSFGDSVLRNLLRAADLLPAGYAVGALVAALDPRFRRLGDLVAGTMVIVEERAQVAASIHVDPPTAKELAKLPSRIDLAPEEQEAIEVFLRRLDRLSPARATALAELAAPTLAERLGVRYRDPVRFLVLVHHRVAARGRP